MQGQQPGTCVFQKMPAIKGSVLHVCVSLLPRRMHGDLVAL